jgi:6-phosphogluconolactonase/glucosamine-6-phosphate isomerase/deaminase
VGHDGHFGSIFPGTSAVLSENVVAKTETDIFKVNDRLTLTATAILKSKKILVILQGQEKENVLARLRSKEMMDPLKFPVELLKKHADVTVYYMP